MFDARYACSPTIYGTSWLIPAIETAPKLTYKEYRNLGGELIPLYYCTSLEAAEHGGQQLLVALEYSETRVVGVGFVAGLGAGASERGKPQHVIDLEKEVYCM